MEQHAEKKVERRNYGRRHWREHPRFRRFDKDCTCGCFTRHDEGDAFAVVERREMPPGFSIYFVTHKYDGKHCKWHKWINYAELDEGLRKDFENKRGEPIPARAQRRY